MRSIEKFWKMVGILERAIENSNNEQLVEIKAYEFYVKVRML